MKEWKDLKALNCTTFDGVNIKEGENADLFLMPGLIDAHTHLVKEKRFEQLVSKGVTTTCDVCVSKELKEQSDKLNIWTSYFMAAGNVTNGCAYVERAVSYGANYIKVILEEPPMMASSTMSFSVLCDIVKAAHAHGLKVVTHAVTVPMVQMAVDAGVDILLHVPMKGEFPESLAEQIAKKGIAIVPTLVMMKAFSRSPIFGYKREHYQNAEKVVRLLRSYGVPILVGTDSHDTVFLPKVCHGSSMHEEMKLLVDAGLSPLEVLQGATSKAVEAFGLSVNEEDRILIAGRPDKCITDIKKIKQMWIDGKPIM